MMTMKNILIVFIISLNGLLNAQEAFSFFLEIPDKDNIPAVTYYRNGNRKVFSKTKVSSLNKLLNSYEIYKCKKVFSKSKRKLLQNIYQIECNDSMLMHNIKDKFKLIYPMVEHASGKTLATPDDYSSNGGFLASQVELDYIRAPEAWDISTGSKNIIIGIADKNFLFNHEDLKNTLDIVVNESSNSITGGQHGSVVSSYAAAETNNNLGVSSIGYNTYINAGVGTNTAVLDELSTFGGVKIVNASWLSHSTVNGVPSNQSFFLAEKTSIDEIINDRGVVVVAAAGNGEVRPGNPNHYVFPASYKDVISVSSIGHNDRSFWNRYDFFLDTHEYLEFGEIRSHQHNDSIDIVAPGYGLTGVDPYEANGWAINAYGAGHRGTSFAAPIVSGTVALMFDVNYCLSPKEVETILKLTAVKIDTLPQNIQYYGKLGAGKLDAYEAVKMAKDMADAFGTVEVKDRILYRPWFYKLETAPFEIKMTNNNVTGGSKLKFRARNNIEILSGDYHPDIGGYIDLHIDSTLAVDCTPAPINNSVNTSRKVKTKGSDIVEDKILESKDNNLLVFPNPTTGIINIVDKKDVNEIVISDITGKTVYNLKKINSKTILVDISKFNSGIYFLKIKAKNGEISSRKIIKQ